MRKFTWRLLLLAPVVFLLPYLEKFAYPAVSAYSDLAISHYPNAVYLLHSITQDHQIPLWSGSILSGYPFAANPLSGLWYPPGWLALLFSLPLGFNLVSVLHVIFGGLGMVFFLRGEGVDELPAVAGGLVFELIPRLFAHYAAGHLTLVYAISWTPWLLFAAQRSAARLNLSVWQGLVLGMILLADTRWAAYAVLIWVPYRLILAFRHEEGPRFRILLRSGFATACQVAIAIVLAAVLLVPMLEYTSLSTRQFLEVKDTLFRSLNPARLMGLLFPSFDGNTEWTVYPGAFATLAFLWVAGQRSLRKGYGFWLLVVPVSLLLALGSYLPGMNVLAQLPGFRMLRVPPRFVLLAGFALAVLVARTLDSLARDEMLKQKAAFFARLFVAGAAGFAVLVAIGAWVIGKTPPVNFLWGAGAAVLAALLILLRDRGTISRRVWIGAAMVLLVADLAGANAQSAYFRTYCEVSSEGISVVDFINSRKISDGLFRAYSPSYSLPQQTSAVLGLQLAEGIDPLQLFDYAKFMTSASGIPWHGYDVVLPPLLDANSEGLIPNHPPDLRMLGLLNVKYLAVDLDLSSDGLVEVKRLGQTRIYQNKLSLPRAWIQPENAPIGEEIASVQSLSIRPNDIALTVHGPGLLVLSEIMYPGWRVWVDNQEAQVVTVSGILRGVKLDEGEHHVYFAFRPISVYLGLALSVLGWAALAGYFLWTKKGAHDFAN